MLTPYLIMVLTGFATFMVVLGSTYAYVKLGDRKAARAAVASARQVAPVVAAPRVAETVDVGGKVGDLVGVH